MYSIHASTADLLAAAEEPARNAREPARATAAACRETARGGAAEKCTKANTAAAAALHNGKAEAAAAVADSAKATGHRHSIASTLRSARAAVRRVSGLLRSSQPAAAAGRGRLHASAQDPGACPTAVGPPTAAVDSSAAKAAPHGTAPEAVAAREPPKPTPEGPEIKPQALPSQALLGWVDSLVIVWAQAVACWRSL